MKRVHALELITPVAPDLIEEADIPLSEKRQRPPRFRAAVIAACACLALVGSSIAADAIWGVRMTKLEHENGLKEVSAALDGVERIPVDSLPQEVVDLPVSDWMELNSVEEAEKLLGISLPGFAPFQNLERSKMTFVKVRPESKEKDYDELTSEDLEQQYHTHCYLSRAGIEEPTVVEVTAQYTSNVTQWPPQPWEVNKHYSPTSQQVIHYQVSALLFTENFEFSSGGGIGWMGGESVQVVEQSSIITADGQEMPVFSMVMSLNHADETERDDEGIREFIYVYSYFLQDGVLYRVQTSGWQSENGQSGIMTAEILREALEDLLTAAQPVAP